MTNLSEVAQKIKDRAAKAAVNFEEFCRFVGGIAPAKHQLMKLQPAGMSWFDAFQLIGDEPDKGHKVIVIAPPGAGKSQLTVLFLAWMIGKYPNEHFGLLSYANKVAWGRSAAIRKIILENRPYRLVFPHVKPDPNSWGSEEFTVKRESTIDFFPTMRCGGTRSAVVAYRLSGLVLDDPTDRKQNNNKEQREQAFENYEQSISTRMLSHAWQLCVSTRWGVDDFVSRLLKREREGWRLLHTKALVGGESFWPEKYPLDQLKVKQYESPELFQTQYMGNPQSEATSIIKRKRISFYQDAPSLELAKSLDLLVATGWDCALKDKESNDWTVCYVGGLDKFGHVLLLDRRKERIGTGEIIDEIYSVQDEWEPFCQWVEDTAAGTPAIQTIMEETPSVPLEPVTPPQGGKRSRAHSLSPYIHRGQVVWPAQAPWLEDSLYYITNYPMVDYDDDIDALWVLLYHLLKEKHPSKFYERRPTLKIKMV